jgi:nitrite reductase/ring-hydroxylating ferredoxin subunit
MAKPSVSKLSEQAERGDASGHWCLPMKYEFVPASEDSRLDHVGSYRRRLPVSLERMYENTLDWQHLPHLHSSSFTSIAIETAGAWGWRAAVTSGEGEQATTSRIELNLDRDARRWITRNLAGPHFGAEIWTHVFVVSERVLDIVVDFFVPDVPAEAKAKVGQAYATSYERLYDEDVAMMTERQRQLDQRLDGVDETQVLELDASITASLPQTVTLSGRRFVLNRLDGVDADEEGQWVVYPAQCPHQLGSLESAPLVDGVVRCPWHGYEFDVRTGACISGSHCQFGRMPTVAEQAGTVTLRWA